MFLAVPTAADQRVPLRIGAAEFPPRAYFEDGQLVGSNVDIWRGLLKEAGLDWEARLLPPSRLYHSLTLGKGSTDLWVSIEIESMLKLGVPVKPSLFSDANLLLYAQAGAERQNLATLRADALIVVIGYKYDGLLDAFKKRSPETRIIVAPNHKAAFSMLKAGRAAYVLDYKAPGTYFADQTGLIGLTHTAVYSRTVFFFISHNAPDKAELQKRLEAASKRILARRAAETEARADDGG